MQPLWQAKRCTDSVRIAALAHAGPASTRKPNYIRRTAASRTILVSSIRVSTIDAQEGLTTYSSSESSKLMHTLRQGLRQYSQVSFSPLRAV